MHLLNLSYNKNTDLEAKELVALQKIVRMELLPDDHHVTESLVGGDDVHSHWDLWIISFIIFSPVPDIKCKRSKKVCTTEWSHCLLYTFSFVWWYNGKRPQLKVWCHSTVTSGGRKVSCPIKMRSGQLEEWEFRYLKE